MNQFTPERFRSLISRFKVTKVEGEFSVELPFEIRVTSAIKRPDPKRIYGIWVPDAFRMFLPAVLVIPMIGKEAQEKGILAARFTTKGEVGFPLEVDSVMFHVDHDMFHAIMSEWEVRHGQASHAR